MRKILCLICCLVLLAGCGKAPESARQTVFAMNTAMSITVYGDNCEEYAAAACAEINRLSHLWSATEEDSELYRLNSEKKLTVSAETAELIAFASEMNTKTNGALDITLYPVLREWGFTTGEYKIPDSERISVLLSEREAPIISGGEVTLSEKTELDFGAVAKGYAGDFLCELLRERGVSSALLDLGGNIQLIGSKPDGKPWKLGIKNPNGEGNIAVLSIEDCAVVTSGDYERYFVGDDGECYCHIIDPKTGAPARSGLSSVTVIGDEGKICDALSTALFVMGEKAAVEYWRENGDFEMLLVSSDGRLAATGGLVENLEAAAEIRVIE